MKICNNCNGDLEKLEVHVEGTDKTTTGWKCKDCGEYCFDKAESKAIYEDLSMKETPALNIRQKIVKLSKDRLGIYLNKDIVRCGHFRQGEEVYVSMLDEDHILISKD